MAHVDDEQHGRQVTQFTDAAQAQIQLLDLALDAQALRLLQQVEFAGVTPGLQLAQVVDALADGAPVGERAAEPTVVDIGLRGARRLAGDCILSLALGAHKQHVVPGRHRIADGVICLLDEDDGLLQIQDVDPVPLGENIRFHLRVPAPRPVPEVHPRFQKCFHRHNGHEVILLFVVFFFHALHPAMELAWPSAAGNLSEAVSWVRDLGGVRLTCASTTTAVQACVIW